MRPSQRRRNSTKAVVVRSGYQGVLRDAFVAASSSSDRAARGIEQAVTVTTQPAPDPAERADKQHAGQHTERMRCEERTKLTIMRVLVPVAILISSPVLLMAGAPIRRRYLRYVYRDEAPQTLEKERAESVSTTS